MTVPDPTLAARLAEQMNRLAKEKSPSTMEEAILDVMDGACGDAYRSGQLITLSDHTAAVQAAVAKAVEAERAWFPIETAPRDGTWFLAYTDMSGFDRIRHVHFSDAYDRFPINSENIAWPRAPTHWRPLPAIRARKGDALTEYERKVAQMKEDFPNGI